MQFIMTLLLQSGFRANGTVVMISEVQYSVSLLSLSQYRRLSIWFSVCPTPSYTSHSFRK